MEIAIYSLIYGIHALRLLFLNCYYVFCIYTCLLCNGLLYFQQWCTCTYITLTWYFAGSVAANGNSSGRNVNRQSCASFYRPLPEETSERRYIESGTYEIEDEDVYTVAIPREEQKPSTAPLVASDYETPQPIRTLKKQEDGEYSTICDSA